MARSDNVTGALLMVGAMAGFTFNDTAMKAMAGDVPLYQLLFLRGILTTIAVAVMAWRMKVFAPSLPARDWQLIGLRTVAETGAAYFFLTALFNMPLANVTAILQALPLTVTLAAALVFREAVGWRRMLAILAGFVGVMLIVRPGASDFNAFSVYALIAVLCVTVRDLVTRRLSSATPSIFVTLVTSVAIMAVFGFASLAAPWAPMGGREVGLITVAATCIIAGYLFSIMVMRVGEISFVAPFRYTGLLWALLLGWVVFGEWPVWQTLLGAGVVTASGVFTLYREARLARRRPVAPSPHSR